MLTLGRTALSRFALAAIAFCALTASGCVSVPYAYGTGRIAEDAAKSPPVREQFLVGKPNKFLDASDWFWPESLLGKLLLWNKNVDSHQISPETVEAMQTYMAQNDLRNVQVLVNAYAPGNQWQRLFKNKTVGAGWRYTFGIVSVIGYTILPGRFFGGDAYNPFTNTVYLYSNEPAIALHEAGHSKDFGRREWKGTNAALYQIPFVNLYYEANASSDALSYLECRDPQGQKDAYKLLYPAWSTYAGGNVSDYLLESPWWSLTVIPGHIVGRIQAAHVKSCTLEEPAAAQSQGAPVTSESPTDSDGSKPPNVPQTEPSPEPTPETTIGTAESDSAETRTDTELSAEVQ